MLLASETQLVFQSLLIDDSVLVFDGGGSLLHILVLKLLKFLQKRIDIFSGDLFFKVDVVRLGINNVHFHTSVVLAELAESTWHKGL